MKVQVVSEAGTPVASARVYFAPTGATGKIRPEDVRMAEARTNAMGNAQFALDADLGPGSIIATCSGYRPTLATLEPMPGASPFLKIVLQRGLVLRGVVTDPTGVPVGGLLVLVYGPRSGGIWQNSDDFLYRADSLPDHARVETDASGRFELTGLRDVDYVVTVLGNGYAPVYDSRKGVVPVRAGTEDLAIAVRRTLIASARLMNAGRQVNASDVLVDVLGSEGITSWSPSWAGEHMYGDRYPAPAANEWRFVIQADGDTPDRMRLRIRITAVGLRPLECDLPLSALVPWALAEPRVLELETDDRATGTVHIAAPPQSVGTSLSPYSLLVREHGATDKRWYRRVLDLANAQGLAFDLPEGQYDFSGLYLEDLGTGGGQVSRVIQAGRDCTLRLNLEQKAVGTVRLEATTDSGVPLGDYYYRIVPRLDYLQDNGRLRFQAYVAGAREGERVVVDRGGVPLGEYVVVIAKHGYEVGEANITVEGVEPVRVSVILHEKASASLPSESGR